MKTECTSFSGCKAPICPLDNSYNLACWFPDEDICHKRAIFMEAHRIIKTQRKISRKASMRDLSYTVSLLNNIKRVHTSIKGRDSDNTRKPRLL